MKREPLVNGQSRNALRRERSSRHRRGSAPIAAPHPAAQVPAQAEPGHDELEYDVPGTPRTHIPDAAHWSEKARPRAFAGTLFFLALVGVVTALVLTITTESPAAIAALAASAFVAVIFRGDLMAAPITTVDLKGSVLHIHKGGVLDEVNLADPIHVIDLISSPATARSPTGPVASARSGSTADP